MNHVLRSPLLWLGLGAFWGMLPHSAQAQVGIGTRTPDPSAMLEIRSTNKGLLIPRVALTGPNDATTVPSPATSLLVFNTNAALAGGTGFYYNDGTPAAPSWVRFVSSAAPMGLQFWSVNGNAGTDPATNFLGTTDAQPIAFRVNSVERMRLFQSGGLGLGNTVSQNLMVGFGPAQVNATGTGNTLIGIAAGQSLTSGSQNTIIGTEAGRSNATGAENTFIGRQAGQSNVSGIRSTFLGASAGANNTGDNNTFLGYGAGLNNNIGTGNTGVGLNAGSTSTNGTNNTFIGAGANSIVGALSNATAIGANALVGSSNTISLGDGSVRVGIGTLASVPAKTFHVVGGARITELGGPTIGGGGDRMVVTDLNGDLSTRPLPTTLNPGDFVQNNQTSTAQNAGFNVTGNGNIGGTLVAGGARITSLANQGDRIVVVNNAGILATQQAPQAGIFNQSTLQTGANFNIDGSGSVGTTLNVGSTATIGGNATVAGTLGVAGASTLGSTLSVAGATTIGSSLSAGAATLSSARVTALGGNGNRLVVTNNNGDLTTQDFPTPVNAVLNQTTPQSANFNITGNGTVGGTTTTGTLAVTNGATVGSTLGVGGNTTVGGTLAVSGATTLGGNATLSTLAGTGNRQVIATPSGQLTTQAIPAPVDAILNQTTQQVANFNISGNGTIGGTASANSLTVASGASIGNALTVGASLSVTGNEFISGTSNLTNLNVSGNTVLGNPLGSSLTVNGASQFNGLAGTGTRLVVASPTGVLSTQALPADAILNQNATDQAANFRISGSGQVGSLAVNNAATVGTNLSVNNNLSVNGTSTLSSATVTNGATVGGNLGVAGTSILNGAVAIGTPGAQTTLNVNGTGTFTNLAGTGNRLIVASPSGQISPTNFNVPTNGFVENRQHVGGINSPAGQQGSFDLDGTGYLGGTFTTAASVIAGADLQAGADGRIGANFSVGAQSRFNGNVGIGLTSTTTAITERLVINGTIVPQFDAGGNLGQTFRRFDQSYVVTGNFGIDPSVDFQGTFDRLFVNGNVLPVISGVSNLGSPTQLWNTVYATNGVVQTSDARMKTNITGLGYGLETVMAMRPVRYAWKKTPNQTNKIGFVAQELQQLVPEVVSVANDADHTLGVNYAELVPVLVKALQEQQQQLDAMRGRAEKAEAGLQSFEARLRALEAGNPTINATAQGQR